MPARHAALVVFVVSLLSVSAAAATCNASLIGNGVCDCGCSDSDCPAGDFIICQSNQCPSGKVPWEHMPSSCMNSACGDGWNDPAAGEVCDDGNALASGGCSANCKAVSPGYVCGAGATGCHLAPPDAGTTVPDAGPADSGAVDSGVPNTGAADAGGADAGSVDAGQPPVDPGPVSGTDAGADTKPAPQGGCSAVPAAPVLFAALALWRTRRRTAS